MRTGSLLLLIACLLMTCTTSPLNRRQIVIYSEAEMAQQGEQSYRQMQQELPISADTRETQYIQCIADYVVTALEPAERGNYVWEVTVFDDEQANAFALPGGKIGVYNGLLDVAVTQHQMASVIAHEVGHVLANHSNERASQAALRNVGLAAAQILGASSSTIEAIDVGSRYGIFLPFNRTQESEADAIGVQLMARAGFDPEASIILWQNMMATGDPSPPQLLSTHPSPASRMNELRQLMEPALATRIAANSRGINPDCAVPENNLQF